MENHNPKTNHRTDDKVASGSRQQSSSFCEVPKRPRLSSAFCINNRSPTLGATADPQENDDDSDETNISATINAYTEPSDEAILKWQEDQLAHSIVDNTVNRVVESYLLLFDEAEDSQNTGLEESAILMAINEHGLQNNDDDAGAAAAPNVRQPSRALSAEQQQQPPTHSPPPPLQHRQHQCAIMTSAIAAAAYLDNAIECLTSDDSSDDDEDANCGNSSQSPNTTDNFSKATASESTVPTNSEHFDFMEAAVAVAIRKKGLTPHSMQLSPNR